MKPQPRSAIMACRIRRPKRPQQRNDHGENDVTGFDDPEMQDLLGLAARLGRDPLVVQGPGGNISLKRDGVVWVKASGSRMMEATSRSSLIPVDFVAVLDGLAAGDPACETCSEFVRHDLVRSPLRPSIETTLHAVMPQRGLVHGLCVDTISLACPSNAIPLPAPSSARP